MLIDYDLVIIGNNTYAYKLVNLALSLQARIAWVWNSSEQTRQSGQQIEGIEQFHQVWQILKNKIDNNKTEAQVKRNYKPTEQNQEQTKIFAGQMLSQELVQILENQDQSSFAENLQNQGIDLIYGQSQFQSSYSLDFDSSRSQRDRYILTVTEPTQNFAQEQVRKQRHLSARAYVIADDQPTNLGKIFGLASHSYLTATQLLQPNFLANLPKTITVLGSDPNACAIAQFLNYIGIQTSLVTRDCHILPEVDVAIARTLQAHLEAEGIAIYTNLQITAVSETEQGRSRLWVSGAGKSFIEGDRLVVPIAASGLLVPNQPASSPYIWQCHDERQLNQVIQQTLQPSILQFWRRSQANSIPEIVTVPTLPPVAQVGLTEDLARRRFRHVVTLEQADANLGIGKIICDRQGYILGASMCGDRAVMIIKAIAIAIQGDLKASDLHDLQGLNIAALWQDAHLQPNERLKIKNWFTFRRDWQL